ncbi:MAG: hypothetical protein E6G68_03590 [Actinobacteria bacterium]|nr:MAG: hypothetical protein E6G68_03590 [Actinomycetota bacterium]
MTPLRRVAVAVVGSVLLVLPAVHARAASPSATGYWWRLQKGSGSPLPPPPFVPNGGLWAATDPNGQMAISAMRYRAASGEAIRTVVLDVAQSSGRGALLLACPARSAWRPVQAGAWSEKPTPACNVAFVNGVVSGDGKTWSFDVRGLARTGTLDIVILPPADASSTFSIAFDAPDRNSIVTERFPGSPSPSASPSPSNRRSPSPAGSPSSRHGPSPITTVLAEKTTPPATTSGTTPEPTAGSPSPDETTLASPPIDLPPYRSPWVMTVALALPLAVLAGIFRARWYT